jgi:hypothetical protein
MPSMPQNVIVRITLYLRLMENTTNTHIQNIPTTTNRDQKLSDGSIKLSITAKIAAAIDDRLNILKKRANFL